MGVRLAGQRFADVDLEVDVSEFGARGDGVTNNTGRLQAALDALEAAGGGTLHIPAGTYLTDEVIVNGDRIRLVGDGAATVLRKTGSAGVLLRLLGDDATVECMSLEAGAQSCYLIRANVDGVAVAPIERVRLEELRLVCDHRTAKAIFVGLYKDVEIRRCHAENTLTQIADSLTFGITLHSGTSQYSYNATVERCTVRGFFQGIVSYGTGIRQRTAISRNLVESALDMGIVSYHAARCSVIENVVKSCAAGIYADSTVDVDGNVYGNRVAFNLIQACTTWGIRTEEMIGASIVGNTCTECQDGIIVSGGTGGTAINGNSCYANSRYGIWADKEQTPANYHLYDLTFSGNVCKANGADGMRIGGVKRSCIVSGCVLTDNGRATSPAASNTDAGLRLTTCVDGAVTNTVVIVGCTFGNNIGATAGTGLSGYQGYGICLDNQSTSRAVIVGCYFEALGQFNVRSSYNFLNILGNVFKDGTYSLPNASWTASGNVGGGFLTLSQGTAAPTTGTWQAGDRVQNTAPAAGGKVGWVCVTAGTPGTWKPYGAIDA
jgi:hypothetical protein